MKSRVRHGLAVIVAAGSLAAGTSARSPEPSTSGREAGPTPTVATAVSQPGARARVRLEALGTRRTGNTGRPGAEKVAVVNVGDTIVQGLRAGDDRDASVCNALFVAAAPDVEHVFLWKLEVTVIGVSPDATSLRVQATRSTRDEPAGTGKQETRTITLGPDDWHALDFVEDAAGSTCASLLVRVSAQPVLESARRPISVDVWTVDEDAATGKTRSVLGQVTGTTGEAIDFKLPTLTIPAGEGNTVNVTVDGTLRAVVAQDGLDVSVEATRRISWAGAEIRGAGRVEFHAVTDETAALLLPQPVGTLGRSDALSPGVPASVDLARVFAGHRLSLYVKVKLVQ